MTKETKILRCFASLVSAVNAAGGDVPPERLLAMTVGKFITDIVGPNDIVFKFSPQCPVEDGDEEEGEVEDEELTPVMTRVNDLLDLVIEDDSESAMDELRKLALKNGWTQKDIDYAEDWQGVAEMCLKPKPKPAVKKRIKK